MSPYFAKLRGLNVEVLERPRNVTTIAVGRSIQVLRWLREKYGDGRWRKQKGIAQVKTESGRIRTAELTGMKLTESAREG